MADTPSPGPQARTGRWSCVLYAAGLLAVASACVAGWIALALSYSYSEGDRAGYVQKFSRKGWVCKTWEGELAMANLPGAMPEIFAFTVRDEAVAARVTASMGQRVALRYEEHRGLPTTCFGDTVHFVTDVRPVAP
jgi:hypothetical protein